MAGDRRIYSVPARSSGAGWFRSKRFRVEGAPSPLFAVLSPVREEREGREGREGREATLAAPSTVLSGQRRMDR
jgi:hypothetical protein